MNRRVAIALVAATPILGSLSAACSGADPALESSGTTSEAAKNQNGGDNGFPDDSTTITPPHRDAGVRDAAKPPCTTPLEWPRWASCSTNRYFVHRIGVSILAQFPSTTVETRALFQIADFPVTYPCDDLSSVKNGPIVWHGTPLFPGTSSQYCSYTWVGSGTPDWATLASIATTQTGAQGMILTDIMADETPAPTCGSGGVICQTARPTIPCFLSGADTCPINNGIAICPACGTLLPDGSMMAVLPSDTSKWTVTPVDSANHPTSPVYFSAPAGAQTFVMSPPPGTTFPLTNGGVNFNPVN